MSLSFTNLEEARAAARRALPRAVFDFVEGGAEDERTLQRNLDAFAELRLLPRTLTGTPERDLSVTLFGQRLNLPVLIAPTGFAGLLWPKAELAAARAAAAAGTVYVASHGSTVALEELAAAAPGSMWFQIFLFKDHGLTRRFVERAKAARCGAIVVTVDNQVAGNRERDRRNGFTIPPSLKVRTVLGAALRPGWLWRLRRAPGLTAANYRDAAGGSLVRAGQRIASLLDPAAGWEELAAVRRWWDGPLLLKGVMQPAAVAPALAAGVDGLIVSNHGGRQLDGAAASLDALPFVAEAAQGRLPILLDGGVRRGTDVLKAAALGAGAVLVGRPHLWGLAAGGEAGVARVLAILREEIDRALALGGWSGPADLGPADLLVPGGAWGPRQP